MRFFRFFFLSYLVWGSALASAQHAAEGVLHQLPEAEAEKTISLNPKYFVFGESHLEGKEKVPLLIYLHGSGGIGSDIEKARRMPMRLWPVLQKAEIETLIVAPQATFNPMKVGAKGGWVAADLNVLLAQLLKTLPVDPDRVYLSGSSMGGYGTYVWAGTSPEHFAAIAPIVGGIGPLGPKDITRDLKIWGENLATLPMRTYYGGQDRVVPPDRGEIIMEAIEKAGGTRAELFVYDDMGHNAGQRPYSDPEFFRWLFSHKRGQK